MDLEAWKSTAQVVLIVVIIAATVAGIFLSGGACDTQSCITR